VYWILRFQVKPDCFLQNKPLSLCSKPYWKRANLQWNSVAIRDHAVKNFSVEVFFRKVIPLLQRVAGADIQWCEAPKVVA
jgi:DNA mismatch repair protein MutH